MRAGVSTEGYPPVAPIEQEWASGEGAARTAAGEAGIRTNTVVPHWGLAEDSYQPGSVAYAAGISRPEIRG